MELQDKKQTIVFFKTEDLVDYINLSFQEGEKITGFREEVLLGLFLLRWFKDGNRKDSDFLIGFKYRQQHEKEISTLLIKSALLPEIFGKKYADQDTLSDIIIKSTYPVKDSRLDIHFQIKAFPREDKPETITDDLIALLEAKKNVTPTSEVLLIYSHYTKGLEHEKILKYLETYPYSTVIQVFWTNKDTLNFLKLKPATNQHYSLKYEELFKS